ncbi:MAG: LrgB family protein [Gammaproteobacteria bacterium]|nr:LrgB family protein [Gammaproteobacteria bacterium]
MADAHLETLWVYLAASPLLGLTATLLAYSLAYRLFERAGSHPLLHPVVTAVAMLIGFLLLADIDYRSYFDGAQFVHFLLGPATVALAVPLYQQLPKLRRLWAPVLVATLAGVAVGAASSVGFAVLFGADLQTQLSLAPKSVTAPVAMGISEQIGGLPSLTAVLVVVTGILGAVLGSHLFRLLRIRDDSVKGIAMGITAHGIGTARAFQLSREMGAFSGLAMALSALTGALLVPLLLGWLGMI